MTLPNIVVFRMCGEVVSRMCEVVSLNCTRVRVSKMSLRATTNLADACETQVCSSHARVSLVTRARVCQATSGWYCMRDLYKRSRSHRVRSHSNSTGRKPFWAARREVWDRFHAIKKLKEGHTHNADQLHSIICMVLSARA